MSMSMPGPLPLIRDAVPADRPAIVEFNRLLAAETEHKVLDPAILLPSVICYLPYVTLPSVTSCPIPPPAAQPRFPATPSARHSTAGSDRDDWRRRPGAPRDR